MLWHFASALTKRLLLLLLLLCLQSAQATGSPTKHTGSTKWPALQSTATCGSSGGAAHKVGACQAWWAFPERDVHVLLVYSRHKLNSSSVQPPTSRGLQVPTHHTRAHRYTPKQHPAAGQPCTTVTCTTTLKQGLRLPQALASRVHLLCAQ